MGIHHAERVAPHVSLVGRDRGFFDRAVAESLAFHRPTVVVSPVPIFKHQVGPWGWVGGGRVFRRAEQHRRPVGDQETVVQNPSALAVIQAHPVFEFARQGGFHRRGRRVPHGELKHCRRQTGVVRVQGDKGREHLHPHCQRHGRAGVFHDANRVFAAETDLGKSRAVERKNFVAKFQ